MLLPAAVIAFPNDATAPSVKRRVESRDSAGLFGSPKLMPSYSARERFANVIVEFLHAPPPMLSLLFPSPETEGPRPTNVRSTSSRATLQPPNRYLPGTVTVATVPFGKSTVALTVHG